jgi:hypothetical protein
MRGMHSEAHRAWSRGGNRRARTEIRLLDRLVKYKPEDCAKEINFKLNWLSLF